MKVKVILSVLIAALIATACTPKESETQTSTETATDNYFSIELTENSNDIMPFVIDYGSENFLLLKTSKILNELRVISLSYGDEGNLYEEEVLQILPRTFGDFVLIVDVSEGIPTRGIAFTDESGNRRYYYISQSGMDGSVSLNEFQHTPTADLQTARRTFAEYKGDETSVIIPHGYTHIGDAAFLGKDLTSVTIPNSVIEIGSQAFQGNQLSSVIIPSSVTVIEGGTFSFNPLVSITIGANVMLEGDICYTVNEHDAYVASGFNEYYNDNGRAAGTYTRPNAYSQNWVLQKGGGGQSGAFNGVIRAQVENGNILNPIVSELRVRTELWWSEYPSFQISGSYANGGFTVTLPQTPAANLLKNMGGFYGYDPSYTNVMHFRFTCIEGYDNNGSLFAAFKLHDNSFANDFIEYYVSFWYVDRDVTISGRYEGQGYDLSLKKGWNIVYAKESLESGNAGFTTNPPSGCNVKWQFIGG